MRAFAWSWAERDHPAGRAEGSGSDAVSPSPGRTTLVKSRTTTLFPIMPPQTPACRAPRARSRTFPSVRHLVRVGAGGERASRGGPSSSLWSDERMRWLPTPALPSAPLTSNSFRLSASIFGGQHVSADSRSSPLNSAILSQHPSTASSSECTLSDAFAPSTPAHHRRPSEVGGPQASCVVFRPRSTADAKRVHPGVFQYALPPS